MSFLIIGWLSAIVWNLIVLLKRDGQMAKNHVQIKSRSCCSRCPDCKKGRE